MEDTLYNRIEDYLDGALDAAAQQAFEAELATDPALAQALADVREARQRLRRQWEAADAEEALRDTLRQLGRRHFTGHPDESASPANTRPARRRRLYGLLAAAAVVLLGLAWWFLRPPADERLYARYRQFPEAAFTLKSGTSPDTRLAAASEDFNAGRYEKALPVFQNHLSAQPDDDEARLFAGLCLLELNRPDDALALFRDISPGSSWADEANWFRALATLRAHDRSGCAALLRAIPAGSAHYEEAQALLRALE